MPIVTPVVIRRNRVANRKTKNKTGATRYARQSRVEGYLKKPVLGSAPSTFSWVGARAFDPTSLPPGAGTWRPRPMERNRRRKKRQKHAGTGKKNQRREPGKETPAGPTRTGRTRHQDRFAFRFCECRFWGRRPLLGSRVGARGQCTEPSTLRVPAGTGPPNRW